MLEFIFQQAMNLWLMINVFGPNNLSNNIFDKQDPSTKE